MKKKNIIKKYLDYRAKHLRKRDRENSSFYEKVGYTVMVLPLPILGFGAMFDPTGIIVIPLVVISGFGGGGFVIKSADKYHDFKKTDNNKANIAGMNFTGNNKSLNSIIAAQSYINYATEKYKDLEALPEKIKKDLALHLEDMQEVLEELNAPKDFAFQRIYKNKHGHEIVQNLSLNGEFLALEDSYYLIPKLTEERKAAIKARKKASNNKKQTEEFNRLAQEVKELKSELEDIKKPTRLDKPKSKF